MINEKYTEGNLFTKLSKLRTVRALQCFFSAQQLSYDLQPAPLVTILVSTVYHKYICKKPDLVHDWRMNEINDTHDFLLHEKRYVYFWLNLK